MLNKPSGITNKKPSTKVVKTTLGGSLNLSRKKKNNNIKTAGTIAAK